MIISIFLIFDFIILIRTPSNPIAPRVLIGPLRSCWKFRVCLKHERIYADLRRCKRGDFTQRWQPIFLATKNFKKAY